MKHDLNHISLLERTGNYIMSKNIEKIQELEKNNRLISDNLIDAIWTIDVETLKFDYMTESIYKISGFTSDQYLNYPAKDRMTPESFLKISDLLMEEIPEFESGKKNVRSVEVELIHKDGHTYWAEVRARLYREPGFPMKVIGVTRDITLRKKAEQKQTGLIEKLEKALGEKNKLLKENKMLRKLLPICSGCKRIRDEDGKWWPMDAYLTKKTDIDLSHTICLDCKDVFYGK